MLNSMVAELRRQTEGIRRRLPERFRRPLSQLAPDPSTGLPNEIILRGRRKRSRTRLMRSLIVHWCQGLARPRRLPGSGAMDSPGHAHNGEEAETAISLHFSCSKVRTGGGCSRSGHLFSGCDILPDRSSSRWFGQNEAEYRTRSGLGLESFEKS